MKSHRQVQKRNKSLSQSKAPLQPKLVNTQNILPQRK